MKKSALRSKDLTRDEDKKKNVATSQTHMASESYNSARYLDVTLFADRVSLILKCFLESRETYEFPRHAFQNDFPEALEFFKEAKKNGDGRPNNLHISNNGTSIIPSSLVSEIFNFLKREDGAVQEHREVFCEQSITTLKALMKRSKQVTNGDVESLKVFFDALRELASQKNPKYIDMGGYVILIR